jgi:ornithine cyclodeaminase/alanine dehydrogenase-like protein (mu-crystallin family)
MPFTILTDGDVRDILLNLNKEEVLELQTNLAEALHSYSTGDTNSPCCASYQPARTKVRRNGITTLFMPATTGDSIGMKIVALDSPDVPSKKSSISSHSTESSLKSVKSDLSNMTLSPTSTMSSSDSITGSGFQPPPSLASTQSTNPKGTVTMMDTRGNPIGILNAEELTAFRTALASTILFQKREHVHTITVFGAGRQAYWHIRLALLFKGDQIKHVNIINRSLERSLKLMKSFQPTTEGETLPWRSDVKFSALSPEFGEYGRLLKEQVRKADAIFCCTPSTEPLFPPEFLTSHNGQKKGRYISAIGSYAPHMTELHPDILKHATSTDREHQNHHHPHFKQAKKSGVVIVDSLEGCLKEAGEVVQAKLKPEHLVEVGELMMIKKSVMREMELGGEGEKGLKDWLFKGTVIYKSVGLGLMDLTVGADLVRLARERGVGVHVDDF